MYAAKTPYKYNAQKKIYPAVTKERGNLFVKNKSHLTELNKVKAVVSTVFCFFFVMNFLLVLSGKLSWLPVGWLLQSF